MTLSRSGIEYVLNPDGSPGLHWGIFTGCEQPASVCATRSLCWARGLHRRFKDKGWAGLYNPDFKLKFNKHLLDEPFRLRKPSTIAVAFTGDMFGPGMYLEGVREVLDVVRVCRRHTFFFLTKSPENLMRWANWADFVYPDSAVLPPTEWPPNAWVGTSVVSDGTMTKALTNLACVEARVKWLSIEPLLGAITMRSHPLTGVSWIVLGSQSGPGATRPRLEWIQEIIGAVDKAGCKLWLKNNLLKQFSELPKRQELPHETQNH